ncbi:MAG: hypothetical protein SFX73_02145 [Kofleriaceae bacterium]|nr:hypothetical protein [Kofleriaceae bacterium]
MKNLFALSTCLFLAACGDDIEKNNPDAGSDAPVEYDAPTDAPIDAPPAWTKPAAQSFQWSAMGPDRAFSVAVDSTSQKFYVAGYASQTVSGDKKVVVTRLLPNGTPDTTWAQSGTFDTGLVFKGSDDEIDVVVANGAIYVSATVAAEVANNADAGDTDIAVVKLESNTTTGAAEFDTEFGGDGKLVHSLNTSAQLQGSTTQFSRDGVRALAVDSNGAVFIHAVAKAKGNVQGGDTARTDTDFVVAKFIPDGDLDDSFAGDGLFEQDLYNNGASQHTNATPRGIAVLANGAVLAGGYANAGLSTGPQIVMYRLTAAGELDTAFAPTSSIPGVSHVAVLAVQTEMYNFALHGTHFVTGGYGRNTGDINDWVSLRFDAATAARDTTFGGAAFTEGKVFFDPTPTNSASGSNCRNAVSLPGDKTILLGSSNRDVTTNGMTANMDAAFAILTSSGALDTAYGTGIATYALGTDGADAFWGAAANNTHVLVVGWRGGTVSPQTTTDNDDAYAVLLGLE